jgi:hypothetical protein
MLIVYSDNAGTRTLFGSRYVAANPVLGQYSLATACPAPEDPPESFCRPLTRPLARSEGLEPPTF